MLHSTLIHSDVINEGLWYENLTGIQNLEWLVVHEEHSGIAVEDDQDTLLFSTPAD